MSFKIEFYKEGEKNPVKEYLQSLPNEAAMKTARTITLLREYGNTLSMPLSRPLGDGLFELRIRTKTNNVRVLYFFVKDSKVILLHAFTKKTQKTPKNEIELARQRKNKYLLRGERYEVY